jgi:hypothetical protein
MMRRNVMNVVFLRGVFRFLVTANDVPSSPIVVPWRFSLHVPSKRRFLQESGSVTPQQMAFFINMKRYCVSFRMSKSLLKLREHCCCKTNGKFGNLINTDLNIIYLYFNFFSVTNIKWYCRPTSLVLLHVLAGSNLTVLGLKMINELFCRWKQNVTNQMKECMYLCESVLLDISARYVRVGYKLFQEKNARSDMARGTHHISHKWDQACIGRSQSVTLLPTAKGTVHKANTIGHKRIHISGGANLFERMPC